MSETEKMLLEVEIKRLRTKNSVLEQQLDSAHRKMTFLYQKLEESAPIQKDQIIPRSIEENWQ